MATGAEMFGEWVRECRLSDKTYQEVEAWIKEMKTGEPIGEWVSQGQFARFITAKSGIMDQIGKGVSESMISRVEAARYQTDPPLIVLRALTAFDLLQIPVEFRKDSYTKELIPIKWRYCRTIDEAYDIVQGRLDPFTGKAIESSESSDSIV